MDNLHTLQALATFLPATLFALSIIETFRKVRKEPRRYWGKGIALIAIFCLLLFALFSAGIQGMPQCSCGGTRDCEVCRQGGASGGKD